MPKRRRQIRWAVQSDQGRQQQYDGSRLENLYALSPQIPGASREQVVLYPTPGMIPFFYLSRIAGARDHSQGVQGAIGIESSVYGNRVCGVYGGNIFFEFFINSDIKQANFDRLTRLDRDGVVDSDFTFEIFDAGREGVKGVVRLATDNRRILWSYKNKVYAWDLAKNNPNVASNIEVALGNVSGEIEGSLSDREFCYRSHVMVGGSSVIAPPDKPVIVNRVNGVDYGDKNPLKIRAVVDNRSTRAVCRYYKFALLIADPVPWISVTKQRNREEDGGLSAITDGIDDFGNVEFDLPLTVSVGFLIEIDGIARNNADTSDITTTSNRIRFKVRQDNPTARISASPAQILGPKVRLNGSKSTSRSISSASSNPQNAVNNSLIYHWRGDIGDVEVSLSESDTAYPLFRLPFSARTGDIVVGLVVEDSFGRRSTEVRYTVPIVDSVRGDSLFYIDGASIQQFPTARWRTYSYETKSIADNFPLISPDIPGVNRTDIIGVLVGRNLVWYIQQIVHPERVEVVGYYTYRTRNPFSNSVRRNISKRYFKVEHKYICYSLGSIGTLGVNRIPLRNSARDSSVYRELASDEVRTNSQASYWHNKLTTQLKKQPPRRKILLGGVLRDPIYSYPVETSDTYDFGKIVHDLTSTNEYDTFWGIDTNFIRQYSVTESPEQSDIEDGSSDEKLYLAEIQGGFIDLPDGHLFSGIAVDNTTVWVYEHTNTNELNPLPVTRTNRVHGYEKSTLTRNNSIGWDVAAQGNRQPISTGIDSYDFFSDYNNQVIIASFDTNYIPPVRVYQGETTIIQLPEIIASDSDNPTYTVRPETENITLTLSADNLLTIAVDEYAAPASINIVLQCVYSETNTVNIGFDIIVSAVPIPQIVYPTEMQELRNGGITVWIDNGFGSLDYPNPFQIQGSIQDFDIVRSAYGQRVFNEVGKQAEAIESNLLAYDIEIVSEPTPATNAGGLIDVRAPTPSDETAVLPDEEWVDIAWVDRYFVLAARNGEFYHSGINTTDISQLDFASADFKPDKNIGIAIHNSRVYVFGEYSIENWTHTGGLDFAFRRDNSHNIPYGCISRETIQVAGVAIMFVSTTNEVFALAGSQVNRVSSEGVEFDIGRSVRERIRGMSYIEEGHTFYMLCIPFADVTRGTNLLELDDNVFDWKVWVLDLTTGLWHERTGGIVERKAVVLTVGHIYWSSAVNDKVIPKGILNYKGRNLVYCSGAGGIYDQRLDWGKLISTKRAFVRLSGQYIRLSRTDQQLSWYKVYPLLNDGWVDDSILKDLQIRTLTTPLIHADNRPFRMWDVELEIGRQRKLLNNPDLLSPDLRCFLEYSDDEGDTWNSVGAVLPINNRYRWQQLGRVEGARTLRFSYIATLQIINGFYTVTIDKAYGA